MRLYSYATGEPVDTVEMHVLAKAYRAAWRSVRATEPVGRHVIAAADLVIDFGPVEPPAADHLARPGSANDPGSGEDE